MKLLCDENKNIKNLFWEYEEGIEADISITLNKHQANIDNQSFLDKYGISKFYLDDNNKLCERTEQSPEVIEAINKNITEQRRLRYSVEVDPYKMEALDLGLTTAEKATLNQKAEDAKLKIKQDLPKKEIK